MADVVTSGKGPEPKVNKTRQKRARQRERARAASLCCICCKNRPERDRTVCIPCNAAKIERQRQRRTHVREGAHLRQIVLSHERAGDLARDQRLYEDAAQYYKDALNVNVITRVDQLRISEKLAYAFSLGKHPQAGAHLFERIFEQYVDQPSEAAKTIEILLQRARHLWRNARTANAIPLLEQAVEVADVDGSPKLRLLASGWLGDYLIGMDRYQEAQALIAPLEKFIDEGDAAASSTFYTQKGMLAAQRGEFDDACHYFGVAVSFAEMDQDLRSRISVFIACASWMRSLTDIQIAHAWLERGLKLAREQRLVSYLPQLLLGRASMLMAMGYYGTAHEQLLEVLSYDLYEPLVQISAASTGIWVALHMKDGTLLKNCADPHVLELAFASREPDMLNHVASAFAEFYAFQGRELEAQEILHRTLGQVHTLDRLWYLPLSVAKHCDGWAVEKARGFIRERSKLPANRVALAIESLFEAYVAQREGEITEARRYAQSAVRQFTLLGWHGFADTAQALLQQVAVSASTVRERESIAERLNALTPRERQVAELVFKRYINREIAEMLSISERTVEVHMTSIMHRLDVRSRYQLEQLA